MRALSIALLTFTLAGLLGVGACRSEPFPFPITDDSGVSSSDGPAAGPDLLASVQFTCGRTTCATPKVCCSADNGVTGSCLDSSQCQDPANRYFCDGPATCPTVGGARYQCCYDRTTGATCVAPGKCPPNDRRLCKGRSDCNANENCCFGFGPSNQPYGTCSTGPCPL